MSRHRPPVRLRPRSIAVASAVLAACGGAVQLAVPEDKLSDGGAEAPASDAASASEVNVGPADHFEASDAREDVAVPPRGPCPPSDSGYWDFYFDASSRPDARVCGLVEAGYVATPATVTGELYCAYVEHGMEYGHPCGVVCDGVGAMGAPCVAQGIGDGLPNYDDAGNCRAKPDGSYVIACGAGGRRPRGMDATASRGTSPEGAYLARQAVLEAASVDAFQELARELEAFGAPVRFSLRCRRAAHEEIRHARLVAELARPWGGRLEPVRRVAPSGGRSLLAFAIDNAVEGLVRETYAAAVAVLQSTHAPSAPLRAVFAEIARDELSHATLSRDLHEWALARLDDEERRAVLAAMQRAISDLAAEERPALPALGLPGDARARALLGALDARVWQHELRQIPRKRLRRSRSASSPRRNAGSRGARPFT